MRFETKAIHAGQSADPRTGAVNVPVHLSTTFKQDGIGGLRSGYEYGRTGNPSRDNSVTRAFERAAGQLTATNFYKGATENMALAMADPVEMNLLHMVTADPARTPTLTWGIATFTSVTGTGYR